MKFFNSKAPLLLFVMAFSLISCKSDFLGKTTVKGNRDTTTETRNLSPDFNQIKSAGMMDIVLLPGTQDGTIELTGESNLLKYVETKIEGQSLIIKISDTVSLQTHRPIELKLKAGAVRNINTAGSGDIKTDGRLEGDVFGIKTAGSGDLSLEFTAKTLTIDMAGSGDIRLMGDADNIELKKAGSGDVDAYHLDAKNASINSAGSGDTKVRVSDGLTVKTAGSGNIYYKGEPKMEVSSTGSGKVKEG